MRRIYSITFSLCLGILFLFMPHCHCSAEKETNDHHTRLMISLAVADHKCQNGNNAQQRILVKDAAHYLSRFYFVDHEYDKIMNIMMWEPPQKESLLLGGYFRKGFNTYKINHCYKDFASISYNFLNQGEYFKREKLEIIHSLAKQSKWYFIEHWLEKYKKRYNKLWHIDECAQMCNKVRIRDGVYNKSTLLCWIKSKKNRYALPPYRSNFPKEDY